MLGLSLVSLMPTSWLAGGAGRPAGRAAVAPHRCPPVAAELQVLLERFMPTLPCIDPATSAQRVASVDGGALSSPVWLMPTLEEPERGFVALADRGRQLRCDEAGAAPEAMGVLSECFSGTLNAPAFGAGAPGLDAVAAELGEPVRLVVSLGKNQMSDDEPQLLVATEAGSVLWVGERGKGDAGLGLGLDGERAKRRGRPVTTLLSGVGDVRGLCVSDGGMRCARRPAHAAPPTPTCPPTSLRARSELAPSCPPA